MCSTLFWNKDVLRDCAWSSYPLLVLCLWISPFCLRSPLYFFLKHKTSKVYIEVTVRILLSLNFCLQDSYSFIPVINLITFLFYCVMSLCFILPPPSPKYNAIPKSRMKVSKINIPSTWLLRMFLTDLIIKKVLLSDIKNRCELASLNFLWRTSLKILLQAYIRFPYFVKQYVV